MQIYDRDGLTLGEFIKGDMYIRDLKNTKGHISGLTCGEWHPKAKETILTSSEDGSLRTWDVSDTGIATWTRKHRSATVDKKQTWRTDWEQGEKEVDWQTEDKPL